MSIQIETDSGALELFEDAEEQFYITRQINDIEKLQSRQADYTRFIEAPATPNNLNILFAQGSGLGTSNSPQVKIPCRILIDGITVAPLAYLLHISTKVRAGINALELAVFYGNFNLFDQLLDGDLTNLNLSDLAFELTPAGVGRIAKNKEGVVFAETDWNANVYFSNAVTTFVDLNRAGFWVYSKTLIERILAEAGYTLEIFSAPEEFSTMVIGCGIEKFIDPYQFEGTSVRSEYKLGAAFEVEAATEIVPWDVEVTDLNNVFQGPPDYNFLAPEALDVIVAITGRASYLEGSPTNEPSEVRILKNGVEIASQQFAGTASNQTFFLSVTTAVGVNDSIQAEIFADAGPNPNQNSTMQLEIDSAFSFITPDNEVRLIQPQQHLPKINKKDFLVAVLTHFNLNLVTDDIDRKCYLYEWDELYKQEAQDWSNIVDLSVQTDIDHSISGFAQQSELKYANDSKLFRTDIDYIVNLQSEVLKLQGEVIRLPYTGCDGSPFTRGVQPVNPPYPIVNVYDLVRTESETVFATTPSITFTAPDTFVIEEGRELNFQVGDYIYPASRSAAVVLKDDRRIIEKISDNSGRVSRPWNVTGTRNNYTILRFEVDTVEAPRIGIIKQAIPNIGFQGYSYELTEGGFTGAVPATPNTINNIVNRDGYAELLFTSGPDKTGIFVAGSYVYIDTGGTGYTTGWALVRSSQYISAQMRVVIDVEWTNDTSGVASDAIQNPETVMVTNPYVATFPDSLRFESIANSGWYRNFFSSIRKPEKIRVAANIPVALLQSIDFWRPVYIRKLGAFYYINKINQFKNKGKTFVDLVRVSIIAD